MKLDIKTTREDMFEQYLLLINPILNKRKLSGTEIKVLSKILYIYNRYLYLGKDNANNIVFHTETKKRIREVIGKEGKKIFSRESFDNAICSLKRKGFIAANEVLLFVPIKDNQININITLVEEQETRENEPEIF